MKERKEEQKRRKKFGKVKNLEMLQAEILYTFLHQI